VVRPRTARQLGQRIQALRAASGLTQQCLARRAGYRGCRSLRKIESGQRLRTIERLSRIAQGLGLPTFALFMSDEDLRRWSSTYCVE
jgi:transcriptional regulator with XRE-family HTH domain